MFNLIAETANPLDKFRSHKGKPLRIHTNGVMDGVSLRKGPKIAEVAALFHDLGKLNPNFQPKLDDLPVSGYSSHAYLSSYAFLCYCLSNGSTAMQELGLTAEVQIYSVLALIAHHHGSLTNLCEILRASERGKLEAFLNEKPSLPISEYLQQWLNHKPFDMTDIISSRGMKWIEQGSGITNAKLDVIAAKLDFFLDTQFGFACLIESDKRDAGNNKRFKRQEQLEWARNNFALSLGKALGKLQPTSELNLARTAVREEAVSNLKLALTQGQRVFSLTAPTGSGKTYTLLAIANEIRQLYSYLSTVYALPFLTITEQVEAVCREDVFVEKPEFVARIDSRAQNKPLQDLLESLEERPDRVSELLAESFSAETFDEAFIITTFVQLFETLLSNRGATLLRLPNFSKTIFLIDEIQALPPRLYVFFTAYLQTFCEKFDAYAVISTATMPALDLSKKNVSSQQDASRLFPNYRKPTELLDFEKFYKLPVFDRFEIKRLDVGDSEFSLQSLGEAIEQGTASSLIILNTIDDTEQLYKYLCPYGEPREDVKLLNTRFTLDDRRDKVDYCKKRLKKGEKIILIATQLIEAGVDIDFPVVFRDLCPLANLIQSAGRCNRNGKGPRGTVWFFELRGENSKSRAELVYRDNADQWILDFSRKQICDTLLECDLLNVQREFFSLINKNLSIGDHPLRVDKEKKLDNLVYRINEAAFETVGTFRLIDEATFGEEIRYYVPASDDDLEWEKLEQMTIESAKSASAVGGRLPFEEMKKRQINLDIQLQKMSGRVVQVRVHKPADAPPAVQRRGEVKEVCGLRKLLNDFDYSCDTGIKLHGQGIAIL